MDCDLQDRPEEILRLYQKAKEGYDIVFARRAVRKDNWWKKFVSKQFYKLYSLATGVNYDPAIANFSIVKKNVIQAMLSMKDYHIWFNIYLFWLGFYHTAIDVQHDERVFGMSSFTFRKKIYVAVDVLVSQSDAILKLTAILGFLITMFSTIIGVWIILSKLFNINRLLGWTSQIVLQCFFGGMTIFSIGILGIYVGKIFIQTKGRPTYIVRQVLNDNSDDKNL